MATQKELDVPRSANGSAIKIGNIYAIIAGREGGPAEYELSSPDRKEYGNAGSPSRTVSQVIVTKISVGVRGYVVRCQGDNGCIHSLEWRQGACPSLVLFDDLESAMQAAETQIVESVKDQDLPGKINEELKKKAAEIQTLKAWHKTHLRIKTSGTARTSVKGPKVGSLKKLRKMAETA